jgi:hypothetical protein
MVRGIMAKRIAECIQTAGSATDRTELRWAMTSERVWKKLGFRIGVRWLWIEKPGRELNKTHHLDTTEFNERHSTELHVSVPKKSSLEN